MRSTILFLLTLLTLVVCLVGCRESETVKPGGDGDGEEGDCPYACVSQLFCVQGDGIAYGEFDCAEDGEVCCDLGASSDSDSDSDTITDTGEEPCPFECMSQYMCNAIDGEEHDGFACEELTDICCEDVVDTDTGYKGTYWKCLICEPDQMHDTAAEQGAGVLGFLWNIVSGS